MVTINKDSRLGEGTYATVYDGSYLGTEVAVKVFKNNDPSSHKAF
jgi:predicted Ser/Thr protein kinase